MRSRFSTVIFFNLFSQSSLRYIFSDHKPTDVTNAIIFINATLPLTLLCLYLNPSLLPMHHCIYNKKIRKVGTYCTVQVPISFSPSLFVRFNFFHSIYRGIKYTHNSVNNAIALVFWEKKRGSAPSHTNFSFEGSDQLLGNQKPHL